MQEIEIEISLLELRVKKAIKKIEALDDKKGSARTVIK